MATGIFAILAAQETRIAAVEADVAALKANPTGGVPQADFDALKAQVVTISTDLDALETTVGAPDVA